MLRVLDLFSGIGGFSLGLERSGGFETVVIPSDGLGTGLAGLDKRAPKTFAYLQERLAELEKEQNNGNER